MDLLPVEVQQYIRHILHFLGMAIATWGGYSEETIAMFVGVLVNAISLGWFLYIKWKQNKRDQQIETDEEYDGDVDTTS